jgi:hypothetical protein
MPYATPAHDRDSGRAFDRAHGHGGISARCGLSWVSPIIRLGDLPVLRGRRGNQREYPVVIVSARQAYAAGVGRLVGSQGASARSCVPVECSLFTQTLLIH